MARDHPDPEKTPTSTKTASRTPINAVNTTPIARRSSSCSHLASIDKCGECPCSLHQSQNDVCKTPKTNVSILSEVFLSAENISKSVCAAEVNCSEKEWKTSSSTSSENTNASKTTPRFNPFEAHMSMDRLRMPIFSPSVFSVIESPSQEKERPGQFWSLEQKAHLFPAEISDDSPWKQETTTSIVDPEFENKTQEAIDLYFSQHHIIKSPEDQPNSTQQRPVLQNRASSAIDLGSPDLSSRRSSKGKSIELVNQWTQTTLTFPPVLPPEVERILSQYARFEERQDQQPRVPTIPSDEPGNLSTSTLRRKLFEGMIEDSSDEDSEETSDGKREDTNDDSAKNAQKDVEEHPDHKMSSPIKKNDILSPEQFPLTPISKMARITGKNPKWSSSPISKNTSRRTSISPPGNLGSPTFSPISSTKVHQQSGSHLDDEQEDKENRKKNIF